MAVWQRPTEAIAFCHQFGGITNARNRTLNNRMRTWRPRQVGALLLVEVPQQLTPIDRRNGTMLQHHQRLDRLKRRRNNGKPEERKRRVMSGGACDDTTVRNAAKAAALATLGWRKVHADYRSDYTHPSCGAVSSIQDVLRHHGFKPTSRF